jgi:hypothetical protein
MRLTTTLPLTVLLLALGTACSTPAEEDANTAAASAYTDLIVDQTTQRFAGTFELTADGHKVKVAFTISDIDWSARTAHWDTTILDRGGHPTFDRDIDLLTTIKVDRCAGCFTFESTSAGHRYGLVRFTDGKLDWLFYEGMQTKFALESVNGAEATSPDGVTADVTGACTLVCGGQEGECKSSIKKSACSPQLFTLPGTPRCPLATTFAAAKRCPD